MVRSILTRVSSRPSRHETPGVSLRDPMMLQRNMLLAVTILIVSPPAVDAAEPGVWSITIQPSGAAPRSVSVPLVELQQAGPILLARNEAPDRPSSPPMPEEGNETSVPAIRVVPASAQQPSRSTLSSARGRVNPADYKRVYALIPFSRTEFDANPGYRHEATMELLLGQLRPRIVAPASSGTSVRVNVGWPQSFSPRRYGYRSYSRYPWH